MRAIQNRNSIMSYLTNEIVFVPVFFALGFTLFWSTFQVGYFGDDFEFLRLEGPWWRTFSEANRTGFLRPIESFVIYISQSIWGDDPLFLHIFNLLGHILYSITTFYFCLILTDNREASLIAAFFTLICQAAVYPLGNIDTISQVFASLFGLLSIVLVCLAIQSSDTAKAYSLSLVAFLFSILSKEGGVGYVPALFLVVVYQVWRDPSGTNRQKMTNVFKIFLPFLLVFLAYFFFYRANAVGEISSDRYSLSIGLNIIKNIGLVTAGLFFPFSKFDIVLALHRQDYLEVAFFVFLSFSFWIAIYVGVREFTRNRGWVLPLLFLLLAYIALSPTLLTQKVGELYLYSSLPFLFAFIGIGLWHLCSDVRFYRRAVALTAGLMLVIVNVTAIKSKANYMVKESTTSTAFYTGIENNLSMYSHVKEIFILDKTNDVEPYYSAFSRPTRSMIGNAQNFLASQYLGLPSIHLISTADFKSGQPEYASSVVLTLTPNMLLECSDPVSEVDCKVLSQVPWDWYIKSND